MILPEPVPYDAGLPVSIRHSLPLLSSKIASELALLSVTLIKCILPYVLDDKAACTVLSLL